MFGCNILTLYFWYFESFRLAITLSLLTAVNLPAYYSLLPIGEVSRVGHGGSLPGAENWSKHMGNDAEQLKLQRQMLKAQKKLLNQQSSCLGCILIVVVLFCLFVFGPPLLLLLGIGAVVNEVSKTPMEPRPGVVREDPQDYTPAPAPPVYSTPVDESVPEPNQIVYTLDGVYHKSKDCSAIGDGTPGAATATAAQRKNTACNLCW